MRKSEMENLMAGQVVLDTRNNVELEIVGVGETKVILINGKEYSKSTLKRYFKLVEEEIPEVVEPLVEEQDTTEQTNTNDLQDTDTQDDQLHNDTEQTTKTHTTEGNTAKTNTVKTNTVQPTIQQSNLMVDINNLVDLHGANLIQRKEYIGVYKEGYKGCIAMIRRAKYGAIHIDMKQKIWNALDEDYKKVVSKEHYTGIYDKSRKLFRVGYVSDLDILEVVICTALQLAS